MLGIMDKDEIIILSSDDDDDSNVRQFERYKPCGTIQQIPNKSEKSIKTCSIDSCSRFGIKRKFSTSINNKEEIIGVNNKVPKVKCNNLSKESPEVVDLEDCLDKTPSQFNSFPSDCGKSVKAELLQSHFKDVIDIDASEDDLKSSLHQTFNVTIAGEGESLTIKVESTQDDVTNDDESNITKPEENSAKAAVKVPENSVMNNGMTSESFDQNLKPFTEFVELCGSLEDIPNDRIRLTKKLMKRYGEARSEYIKSEEFRLLIEQCKEKVNKNNLYLIAKDITAELSFRKKINLIVGNSNQANENSQRNCESAKKVDPALEKEIKETRKRTKFINKILKKLDKLGSKIRELEEQEVDLSDEEESAYVQLQRYRDRFCQIYKKLCKYTNEIPHADRVYNRKICFTESKYPAINKCIEVFLNKTKGFPDFTDIMKLLESQSSSLGLPSNRESLRVIAIEIFQQVGAMLQRRRKYDLWDSFSGFLDNQVDPANEDPVLEKILKDNYETRIKKEQEIFQHYSELQEREKLEPEEVPEEEANRSPSDSGNEDEKEIEEIENDINKRLDLAITKDTKDEGNCTNDWDENKTEATSEISTAQKESKNNFKNCKSLKWRSENSGKSKSGSGNSEDSSTELENDVRETGIQSNVDKDESLDSKEENPQSEESGKNDSDCESPAADAGGGTAEEKAEDDETGTERKAPNDAKECNSNGCNYYQADDENSNSVGKSNDSFDVHYCHVFADNVFENFSEKKKHGEKRKVFRDLTNANRLMDLHGKSRAMWELFVPSFFKRSFREKASWKRKFRLSFRLGAIREQKGAIGREERTGKRVNSDSGGEPDERSVRNNSNGGGNERDGFFSGHGGESHEDGDEDRNRKNGRTGDDLGENKPEEEDDEEEKDESETESIEHSQQTEKTEESQETQSETEWPSGTTSDLQTVYDNHTEGEKLNGENDTHEKICEENEKISFLENNTETETIKKIRESKIVEKKSEIIEKNINSETVEKILEIKEAEITERNEDTEEVESNRKIGDEEIQHTEVLNEIKKNNTLEKEETEIIQKEEEENEYSEQESEFSENDKAEFVETSEAESKSFIRCNSEVREIEPLENVKCILEDKDNECVSETESNTTTEVKDVGEAGDRPGKYNEFDEIGGVVSKSCHSNKRLSREMFPNNKEVSISRLAGEAGNQYKVCNIKRENWSISVKKTQDLVRTDTVGKSLQIEHISPKAQRKSTTSTSDEEIVKRFLLHSPSSISITPPRKLSLSKPPSQAALQALATLRNLKGISATIVRGKPKNEEDVTVIGGPRKRNVNQRNTSSPPKRGRSELPVISNVQSIYHTTPKIVTVQGNVSGFDNSVQEGMSSDRTECDSSSIRISNVWGSLPNNFMHPTPQNQDVAPGCSSYNYAQADFNCQQSNYQPWQVAKKKSTKKKVEYVVLD